MLTTGHTQLPGRGVANVGSFVYLVGNPTRKRSESATAYTGGRYAALKKSQKWTLFVGTIVKPGLLGKGKL